MFHHLIGFLSGVGIVLWLAIAALFFTFYMGFLNIRGFWLAIRHVKGHYHNPEANGEISHFQAVATAISGTVGIGNIGGVAVAIVVGGPGAAFWLFVAGFLAMSTKMVECTLGVKYRRDNPDGSVSGGPMYYMKKRLNIKTGNGKIIRIGAWIGAFFAVATILSSFGTGSLPQINSISTSMFRTFSIDEKITGAILAVLLGPHTHTAVNLIPMSILGVLLLFAGSQLGLTIIDLQGRKEYFVALIILGITLAGNLAAGFIVGTAVAHILSIERFQI